MTDFKSAIDTLHQTLERPSSDTIKALAPIGTLRAGINMSNFLLVTGETESGAPTGVSPGMAAALASVLGVPVEYVPFPSPGAVADAAQDDGWDIGNIGADPARSAFIAFTTAYCEIESTCLVRKSSPIMSFADVDQPGIKIATKERAAYTLWLERHVKHAELVQFLSLDASFDGFIEQELDVLAGLKPRLLDDVKNLAGARLLEDKFTAVQQAIGTPKSRDPTGATFLQTFVDAAKTSGLVGALIDEHSVTGRLSVA